METTGVVYCIEFFGQQVSKKNAQLAGVSKTGKQYRRYRPGIREAIDRLMLQVPVEMRGLNLIHPDIDIWPTVPDGKLDKDSIQTLILDVLVKMKVLKNDSIKWCNGTLTIHPAEFSDYWKTVVELRPPSGPAGKGQSNG